MIHQENDDYQTKDEKLMPYKKMVGDFKKYFTQIVFEQIPRDKNRAIDCMGTMSSWWIIFESPHMRSLLQK